MILHGLKTATATACILFAALFVAQPLPAAPPPEKVIKKQDRDGDGRISRDEWQKPKKVFDRMDANKDGYLTADEIRAWREGRAAGAAESAVPTAAPSATGERLPAKDGWIDVHFHLVADAADSSGFESAARKAITVMDGAGIGKIVAMPPPRPNRNFDVEAFAGLTHAYGRRIAFMGGGGRLNPMIQAAGHSMTVSAELRQEFTKTAENIVASGAKGFGEITAHHVSLSASHGYEWVPPDHPLLLLLADIAARHQLPIDMHFDPIPKDVKTPSALTSPKNPPVLKENLAAFERLLMHNRDAIIVWAHAGSDPVGWYTPDLVTRMLEKHPNLYFSIRPAGHPDIDPAWSPRDGVNYDWIKVFKGYPDRFVLGTDSFVVSASYSGQPQAPLIFEQKTPIQREGVNQLLSFLGTDIAQKIARDNAIRLYRLEE